MRKLLIIISLSIILISGCSSKSKPEVVESTAITQTTLTIDNLNMTLNVTDTYTLTTTNSVISVVDFSTNSVCMIIHAILSSGIDFLNLYGDAKEIDGWRYSTTNIDNATILAKSYEDHMILAISKSDISLEEAVNILSGLEVAE